MSQRPPSLPAARALLCTIGSVFPPGGGVEARARAAGWRIAAFPSVAAFLADAPFPGPGCLVLDIALSGAGGLQSCLAVEWDGMSLVLVGGGGEVLMTIGGVKAGVGDFLAAPFEDCDLFDVIGHAVACSEAALRREEQVEALRARYRSLSGREREVMTLVYAGLLNKQIGHELGISEITVKAHRGNLTRKMQARSFAELIKMSASLQQNAMLSIHALDGPARMTQPGLVAPLADRGIQYKTHAHPKHERTAY